MAFGFRREQGVARGYVNVDNPLFAPGQRLSRRQYDKYVEQIGARSFLPGEQALRDAERRLTALRDALAQRSEALDTRERELAERELALAQRERERVETGVQSAVRRKGSIRYGLDRYRGALDLYQRRARDAGRVINKRQAAAEPEFKAIWSDIKGQKNPSRNPNVTKRNQSRRMTGYNALGGLAEWQDQSAQMQFYRAPFSYRAPKRRVSNNSRNRQRGR
jgi:hypothetical protein